MANTKNVDGNARRGFLQGAGATAMAAMAAPNFVSAVARDFAMMGRAIPGLGVADTDAIRAEIEKRHEESVKRLQTWIKQPSIAAENRGMNEGCELMMQMLRDVGFQQVQKMSTDGQPGIFATLDAARRRAWDFILCMT